MTNEAEEGTTSEEPSQAAATASAQPETVDTSSPGSAAATPASAPPRQGETRRGVFIGRGIFLGLGGIVAATLLVLLGVGIGALLWSGGHHERAEAKVIPFPAGRFEGQWQGPLRQRVVPQTRPGANVVPNLPQNKSGPNVAPTQPQNKPGQNVAPNQSQTLPQQNGGNQQSTVGPLQQLLQNLLQDGNNLSPDLRQLLQQLENFLQQHAQQNAAPSGRQ